MLGVTPEMAFFFILFSNCQSSVSQTKNLMGFVNNSRLWRGFRRRALKPAARAALLWAGLDGGSPYLHRLPVERGY